MKLLEFLEELQKAVDKQVKSGKSLKNIDLELQYAPSGFSNIVPYKVNKVVIRSKKVIVKFDAK